MLVGRHREIGERYPGGKLKPRRTLKPQTEPITGALWQRIRQHGKQLNLDPRIYTQLSRLNFFGELTIAMTAAGFRIAEIYGKYERYKGLRRWTRSPSYESSWGQGGADEELLGADMMKQIEDRIRAATTAFENLVGRGEDRYFDKKLGLVVRPPIPGLIPRRLLPHIEALCVEDRAISPVLYDDLRRCLQDVAVTWKDMSSPAGKSSAASHALRGPSLHFNKHEDVRTESTIVRPEVKPPNLDRIFWIQVARKIAPHLSEAKLGEAWDIQQALKQREIFRRSKERKLGANVVPFER